MATINLGRIKPVWQGLWAASTAYVKDDIVRYDVDSYICTASHTSSADFASDSANWDLVAQGATIPSQTSNANKYLQTDGTNLQWAPVVSDYVKITESYGGNTGGLNFPTIFSDNTEFRRFQVLVEMVPVNATNMKMRFSDASGNFISSGSYDYLAHAAYAGASAGTTLTGSRAATEFRMHDFSAGTDQSNRFSFIVANIGSGETDMDAGFTGHYHLEEGGNNYQVSGAIGGNIRYQGVVSGFQLFMTSGNFAKHRIAIYGIR